LQVDYLLMAPTRPTNAKVVPPYLRMY